MSNLRPMQLPQDIDPLMKVILEGFQYPENPQWSIQTDEREGIVDTIKSMKRLYPFFAFLGNFSADMRDMFHGFIYEEDEKPVGIITYSRRSGSQEWYIADVTVIPAYRRRGIARKLVQAVLGQITTRHGRKAILDVIDVNIPAYSLYKELGFENYSGSVDYIYDQSAPAVTIPEGYTIAPLPDSDWRTRFELENRITPDFVQKYTPVTELNFRQPFVIVAFMNLFSRMSGEKHKAFSIRARTTQQVVGIASYVARLRPGGVNHIQVRLDPAHAILATFMVGHMLHLTQQVSPGRRIEFSISRWQAASDEATQAMGASRRCATHRMGIIL